MNRSPDLLDRWVERLSRWSARLGGLVVLACAFLVTLEVALRSLPGGMPRGLQLHSFDLTNYGFAAAVAFGFAYALTTRAHIRIDLLYPLLPQWLRAVLDAAALLSLALMGAVMAWHGWSVVAQSLRLGAMPNSTLRLPLAIPQSVWATGLSWFALVAVVLAARALWQLAHGQVDRVRAASGPDEAVS